MDKKPRFFIHDRREAVILMLLAVLVAVFAFTLGIHLGKRVAHSKGGTHPEVETGTLAEAPEAEPEVETNPEPSAGPGDANPDESMTQALHDEVARTGIKLDQGHQVNLPEGARSKNGGATTPDASGSNEGSAAAQKDAAPAQTGADSKASDDEGTPKALSKGPAHARASGLFTLQIGSFATRAEAQSQIRALGSDGAQAFVQQAQVPGKGTRFRVMLGGFLNRNAAQRRGERLQSRGKTDSFVIGKMGQPAEPKSAGE